MMKTLHVPLANAAYDIHIGAGLLDRAGPLMASVIRRPRVMVITDETVAALHLETLQRSLDGAGIRQGTCVVPPGEGSKSFATLDRVIDSLLEGRIERSTTLVALGGGVVGDLTGFASAIVMRGVDFVQIPTTLLAQVDSSVGGKTGINTARGKNLVGAFHQPRLVIADTLTLDTLPARERLSGYAEVLKMAVIRDAPFFDWLESHGPDVLNGIEDTRIDAIAKACDHKARIVVADERESGERALLNFGHTFGHALEAETGFSDVLRHGEAVALGMSLAVDLSVRLGLCPPQDLDRVRHHLDRVGLASRLSQVNGAPGWDVDRLMDHMNHDKKLADGQVTFVVVAGIGHGLLKRDIDPALVRAVLADGIQA